MKTILAALSLTLAIGSPFSEAAQSIMRRLQVAPPPPPAPTVTASANFGGTFRPGDHVGWTVDVQNLNDAPVLYLLLVQTPTNLAVGGPQVACATRLCPIQQTDPQTNGLLLRRIPSGAHVTITEDATIVAAGSFQVEVATADNADSPAKPTVIATFTGNATTPPTPPPNVIVSPPAATNVVVTTGLTPLRRMRPGEPIEATFTFANHGGARTRLALSRDAPANLRVLARRGDCPLPCRTILAPGQSVSVSVDADVVEAPKPGGFRETIKYRVGDDPPQVAAVEGDIEPTDLKPLLVLGAIAAAALAGIGGASTAAINAARKARWRRLIAVQARVDQAAGASRTGWIPEAAPSVRLAVRIEPGPARPKGPLPIRRIVNDG